MKRTCWDTRATDSIIKSGQKDTEARKLLIALLHIILASVSFCPLLIIESVARVSQHVLFTHDLIVKQVERYNPIDCFNCKTGVFLRLFTSMFTKQNIYNPRFCKKKKNQLVYGEYSTIIKKN